MGAAQGQKCARLLLADDHHLVIEGFERILEAEFEIVGSVGDGRALVAVAEQLKPDAILVDIAMPVLNGIDAARQLHKRCPSAKIIFVSMHAERSFVIAAFRAGACGYVLKQSSPNELIAAVRCVLSGGLYLPPGIDRKVKEQVMSALPRRFTQDELTPRQREVLQLAAEGRSNKEIAALLHLSVKAVESHKSKIHLITGARNAAELTRYAVQHKLIVP